MSNELAFKAVVDAGWGPARLAEALTESTQTVSNWKQRGFPANRCKAIEALTGVSVRVLRPADWQDYWPDAAPAPAPTPQPQPQGA